MLGGGGLVNLDLLFWCVGVLLADLFDCCFDYWCCLGLVLIWLWGRVPLHCVCVTELL